MLNPPVFVPPQVVPALRPVSVPAPAPLPIAMPSNPSPMVVSIPVPLHVARRSMTSLPTLPAPVPVAVGRAPPPLVPDHLHTSTTTHFASPAGQPVPLPVPTPPSSAMNTSLPVPRPLDVVASLPSTATVPSLPVPPLPLSTAQTPMHPPPQHSASIPPTGPLHAAPPSWGYRPPVQPIAPTPVATPLRVPPVPTVTITTPHSSAVLPALPVPTPSSVASQSLSVLPQPPLLVLGSRPATDAPPLTAPVVEPVAGAATARPPTVEQLPRRSYLASVYPSLEALPELSTARVGFLGLLGAPRVLRHALVTEIGADGNAPQDVPQPIGPAYVVFGGARYESLLLAVPKPPFRAPVPTVDRDGARREEARRLRHLADQLDVAHDYLHLTHGTHSSAGRRAPSPPPPEDSAVPPPPADTSDVAVTRSVWNAAYAGTPTELSALIDADPAKEVVESVGYVVHSRRQWGLKRHNEVYELGLGQKSTPLQFAAVSGRVDNVLLLLAAGARDNQRPFLKDLLPPDSYTQICAIFKPAAAKRSKKKLKPPQQPALATDAAAATATTPAAVTHATASLTSKTITLYAFEMEEPKPLIPVVNPAFA